MGKRTMILWLVGILLLSMLAACRGSSSPAAASAVTSAQTTLPVTGAEVEVAAAAITNEVTASTENAEIITTSAAAAIAANSVAHNADADPVQDSAAVTQISLQGDTLTVTGAGVTVNGRQATITAAGTYNLAGSLTDGQIIVDTADAGVVQIIFAGVDIHSATSAPLNIINAEEVVILLADDSINTIADGQTYTFANAEEDEPNAAIFSKANLTIYGNGSLAVTGNYNDGIASKDGLVIAGGTITVNAVDDGIRGKDYLIVKDGVITVTAQGDGLKADNEEDATLGYIAIENGVINVTAGGDALQAQTDALITGGEFVLTAGGGSDGRITATTSAKGIKAAVNVVIDAGTFTINTADDAIHSNNNLVINGGSFLIATGDDAIHADATLTINAGDVRVTQSFEGIESAVITINGGDIHIVSSDDGLNVAGGNDGSGMAMGPGFGGGSGGRAGRGGMAGQGVGQDTFAATNDQYLYIHGGYIVVDAAGDGIDVNGAIVMTDGVVIVHGPTQQMNGALDYDVSFTMTGGLLVTAGSAGMAQAPDASSTQPVLLLNLNGTAEAGALMHIQSRDGQEILTFAPARQYQSITFSSPALVQGTTYDVYYGGSTTGVASDGLYQGGSYTPGSNYTSFTVSSMVTRLGNTFR
ncbi:MAG: carbohydrate-binding domain-containing protein [Anaerolinea sp.]|nr:carbohydrate-binding domain-containing protein [Anaerolinea sp.]